MKTNKKHINIPVFIPEAACPFQCVFCNQRKISGREQMPDHDEINRTIRLYLSTAPPGCRVEVAFFGGNFTGLPPEIQKEYLEMAMPYIGSGKITGIRMSTRPDYITREGLELLKRYRVTTLELGAQSMDDTVLQQSGRGHTAEDTRIASSMILDAGFRLGLQMMIGLPGDTPEKSFRTAEEIIRLGASETRIYPTLVISNTQLEKEYRQGRYKPLTLDEAAGLTADLIELFEENDITVLKAGLHPSRELAEGSGLIAGPWHPAFRSLAMTRLWLKRFSELQVKKGNSLTIFINPSALPEAVGYKKANRLMLQKNFSIVKFVPDNNLKRSEFRYVVE